MVKGPVIIYPTLPDGRIGSDWMHVGHNAWKIAYHGSPWVFLNHSCRPNAFLKNKSDVVAIRPIKKGTEITLDYSFTEGGQNWKMKCRCGLPECRKQIRSIQSLPETLFRKYQEYVPSFLQKEYLKQKVYVGKIKSGRTVFVKRLIKKGEILFTVEGPRIRFRKPPKDSIGFKWLGISKNEWCIPFRTNPWFYVRHSCDPNVGLVDKNNVVALKIIEANEEIVVDDSITEAQATWKVKCHCGSKNCRGIIRSIQFLPKKQFKKYLPYIPDYFQKIYKLYAAQDGSV